MSDIQADGMTNAEAEVADAILNAVQDADVALQADVDREWARICDRGEMVRLHETASCSTYRFLADEGLLKEVGQTSVGWVFEITRKGDFKRAAYLHAARLKRAQEAVRS
jgi:hypothetical protein